MSDQNQIRTLVFLDSDIRRLLFDSKSIILSEQSSLSEDKKPSKRNFIDSFNKGTRLSRNDKAGQQNNETGRNGMDIRSGNTQKTGCKSKFQTSWKPQQDTKKLCEMIFGTMSMVYHGCTLKIHPEVKSSSGQCANIMISYLSQFDHKALRRRAEAVRTVSEDALDLDLGGMRSISFLSVDAVDSELTSLPSSLANLYIRGDPWVNMNVYGSSCPTESALMASTPNESSSRSIVSSNVSSISKQRWQSSVTSFYPIFHDMSDLSILNSISSQRSRAKLGVAILIPCVNDGITQWIHSHIALIEGYVNEFKTEVENAFFEKDSFYSLVSTATKNIRNRFDHLTTPHSNSESSTWLSLSLKDPKVEALEKFANCLGRLSIREVRFLSLAVTTILSHHMSWINIVAGFDASFPQESLQEGGSLAKVNKRWTQMCDLFGILTSPAKCNRVVIHGKNQLLG